MADTESMTDIAYPANPATPPPMPSNINLDDNDDTDGSKKQHGWNYLTKKTGELVLEESHKLMYIIRDLATNVIEDDDLKSALKESGMDQIKDGSQNGDEDSVDGDDMDQDVDEVVDGEEMHDDEETNEAKQRLHEISQKVEEVLKKAEKASKKAEKAFEKTEKATKKAEKFLKRANKSKRQGSSSNRPKRKDMIISVRADPKCGNYHPWDYQMLLRDCDDFDKDTYDDNFDMLVDELRIEASFDGILWYSPVSRAFCTVYNGRSFEASILAHRNAGLSIIILYMVLKEDGKALIDGVAPQNSWVLSQIRAVLEP